MGMLQLIDVSAVSNMLPMKSHSSVLLPVNIGTGWWYKQPYIQVNNLW